MRARTAAGGILLALVVLGAGAAAALASTPLIPHPAQVELLYAKDHQGKHPTAETDLLPYSVQFEKLLSACKITSSDLAAATISLVGQARAAGGLPLTSLQMLQEFKRHVTWTTRRDCWDTFFRVENGMAVKAAASQIANRRPVTALYVFDHRGANPHSDVDLLPYSTAFAKILDSCQINVEDTASVMVELSEKASELGARRVTTLMMMQAVTRRIYWADKKVDCVPTFDLAEGHMETGGP
jgi:hypothetical protein